MKPFIAASAFLALTALLYLPVGADDSKGVAILVTPKVIAISVDQSQLDYGSPEVGTLGNLPSPTGFNVTNDGTVAVKLQIYGDDTTSTGGSWTLGTAPGTDTYVQRYAVNITSPTYPNEFAVLQKSPEDFLASLATSSSVNIKLALDMPTDTTKLDQHSAPVTIVASEVTP